MCTHGDCSIHVYSCWLLCHDADCPACSLFFAHALHSHSLFFAHALHRNLGRALPSSLPLHTHKQIHTHTHIHTHTRTPQTNTHHAQMHTHHARTYIHTHTHAHHRQTHTTHKCTHTHHAHTYIHTRTNTCTHTCTHARTHVHTCAVSHNIPEAKPIDEGPTRVSLYDNHTLEVSFWSCVAGTWVLVVCLSVQPPRTRGELWVLCSRHLGVGGVSVQVGANQR